MERRGMTTAEVTARAENSDSPRPRRRGLGLGSNPVVLKELRGRMRGARAFIVLTVYLALMSGFTALLYMLAASARDLYGFTSGGQIGRTLFVGIFAVELFLVTFIAPAFTAGAISGERERQTYDLLRTTLLPARALVVGKMLSALAYVLLLILAAVPLQSIAFFFGGVSEVEVILSLVIFVVSAIFLGAVGIYFSAAQPRTLSANVTTYAVTLAITFGPALLLVVLSALIAPRLSTLPISTQTALTYGALALAITNPLSTAFLSQSFLLQNQGAGLVTVPLVDLSSGTTAQLTIISPWLPFTVFYLLLALFFIVRAVRRVNRIDV
jgi:ABC-type transport system involved in multi-copper enzyme maturation permease subunit